jgi:hypothetical protein
MHYGHYAVAIMGAYLARRCAFNEHGILSHSVAALSQ